MIIPIVDHQRHHFILLVLLFYMYSTLYHITNLWREQNSIDPKSAHAVINLDLATLRSVKVTNT